jgi:aspartate carbamoyltransferase catalytic subunit
MNILSCDPFSPADIEHIFQLADDIQAHPEKYNHYLDGKIIATVFYEPSTRTRLSFESAVQRLGGKIISTENAKEMSSAVKGETLTDTMRVLSGYSDAIILRHYDSDASHIAAEAATIPVINAGSGIGEHPTQALLDLYTIYRKKGRLSGLKVAVVGDLAHGRTVHSLIKLLGKYDNNVVYGVSDPALDLPAEYINDFSTRNQYVAVRSLNDLPKDLDVIYQTRQQLERFKENYTNLPDFSINNDYLSTFNEDLMLMHPLPRNNEITPDCDDNPRAFYFKQAHAGIPIRMALLVYIFQ